MRGVVAAAALAVLLVVVFNVCSPLRVVEAIRVVDDIRAGDGPSLLKDVRPPPSRTPVTYAIDGVQREGDLYRPADEIRARMVLVPGVTPAGRDDKRLVEFARTLARARFEVLVPDLVGMRSLRVSADDAVPIADAVRFLDRAHDGKPLGIGAVSFAVGPAVISLFDPRAGPRVDFVLTIGGYYDLQALVTFVTTGYHRTAAGAPWRFLKVGRLGKWVFLLSNASRLDDAADRARLEAMAERKLRDPDADISHLVAGLGPEGQSVFALFSNTDPDRTATLWAALPAPIRDEATRLDLKNWKLKTLSARFVLVHDRNDRIIPAEQARELAAALPPGRAQVFFLGSLHHADPQPPGLLDALTMTRATYAVLSLRDGRG